MLAFIYTLSLKYISPGKYISPQKYFLLKVHFLRENVIIDFFPCLMGAGGERKIVEVIEICICVFQVLESDFQGKLSQALGAVQLMYSRFHTSW